MRRWPGCLPVLWASIPTGRVPIGTTLSVSFTLRGHALTCVLVSSGIEVRSGATCRGSPAAAGDRKSCRDPVANGNYYNLSRLTLTSAQEPRNDVRSEVRVDPAIVLPSSATWTPKTGPRECRFSLQDVWRRLHPWFSPSHCSSLENMINGEEVGWSRVSLFFTIGPPPSSGTFLILLILEE
jgi:hypothetical protein